MTQIQAKVDKLLAGWLLLSVLQHFQHKQPTPFLQRVKFCQR